MKKDDSLRIAYENEYSTFYDRMLYGSAVSLEKMLTLVPDWRGYIAAGFAYDLGLTGVVVDHEKARAYYHKAEDIGLRGASRDTRITIREFGYARHLPFDNYLVGLTDRVKAAYRVLACIIMTSRCEGANQLGVSYTAGLAYSYRLARVVRHIPYEKDPKKQTKEDKFLEALCVPAGNLLDSYSKPDAEEFWSIVENCLEGIDGKEQGGASGTNRTAGAGRDIAGTDTVATDKGIKKKHCAKADAFMAFLLGVMLFDTYRCPIDRNTLVKRQEDYRGEGLALLDDAFAGGCIAAGIYLMDIAKESPIGRALIPTIFDEGYGDDPEKIIKEEITYCLDAEGTPREGKSSAAKALRRHEAGEDRTGKYLCLY